MGGLVQLLESLLIITEILFAADQNDGQTRAKVKNLGDPLWDSQP